MKLSKSCDIGTFSSYFVKNQIRSHSVKLVVDKSIIEVNRFILSLWSDEFEQKADKDNEIFLTSFIGLSDAVNDSVALLHGQEVKVDLTNVSVILKFAEYFKIAELVDNVMMWFQKHISKDTLLDIICIVSDLDKIGYKFDHLTEIVRMFIQGNLEICVEIINSETETDIVKTVIDILMFNGPLVKVCIDWFSSNIRNEKDYLYFVGKLENMLHENQMILKDNFAELMTTEVENVNNLELSKRWIKLMRSITTSCFSSSPGTTVLDVIKFQSWRAFSKNQILKLKGNHGLDEYQYAMICVDWIETIKPNHEHALEIFQSIKQEELEFWLLNCIVKNVLRTILHYSNTPDLIRQDVFKYEYDLQRWPINKQQLLKCLYNSEYLQLTSHCNINSCNINSSININSILMYDSSPVFINIRFAKASERVIVQILTPIAIDDGSDKHMHASEDYMYWSIWDVDMNMLCPFYTKSYREVMEIVSNGQQMTTDLFCLVRKNFN